MPIEWAVTVPRLWMRSCTSRDSGSGVFRGMGVRLASLAAAAPPLLAWALGFQKSCDLQPRQHWIDTSNVTAAKAYRGSTGSVGWASKPT